MSRYPTRRNTNRIPQHDYSKPGQYFITICMENRQQLFGVIENEKITLNDSGDMISFWWDEISNHFTGIELDDFIVMPNHIHGIINIVGVDRCVDPIQNNKISDNNKINHSGRTHRSAPTISGIIQWFKTITTNKYIQNIKNNDWPSFPKRLWQRNFHDHIIRNDKSLYNIRNYIRTNPQTWQHDLENPDRIGNIELSEIV